MAYKLPSASDLIAEAWHNGRRHWPTYLEFTVCFLALGVIQWGVALAARQTITTGSWLAVMLGGSAIAAALLAYVTTALIANVWHGLDDDAAPLAASFREARRRWFAFMVASVMVFTAMVGGIILMMIGLLLFFIIYRFVGYAVIVDGSGPWAAMGESRHLFDERFWSVSWRLVATYAYFFVLTNLLTMLVWAGAGAFEGDLGMYFAPVSAWSSYSPMQLLVATLAPALASALTVPLLTASDLRLWRELKKA